MDWKWIALIIFVIINSSSQKANKRVADSLSHFKVLAIAQCEAMHEHMCPTHLCTVQSALEQSVKIDDNWAPAKHFCDDSCANDYGCRTICRCSDKLLVNYELVTNDVGALSKPELHCRETSVMSMKWDYHPNLTDDNTSVVFAVEILEFGDSWKPYNLTRSTLTVFRGLLPRQKYKFRVTAVGPTGPMGSPMVSDWINTLPPPESDDLTLSPPAEVNLIGRIKYSSWGASAVIGWKPGKDASCTYSVGWHLLKLPASLQYVPAPLSKVVYVLESAMQTEINNLILGESYSVHMKSLLQDSDKDPKEKTELAHSLDVQDCLTAFNHNLSVCQAPPPSDLNIQLKEESNETLLVTVSWKPVLGNPTGYKVFLHDLRELIANRTVKGAESSTTFDKVPKREIYKAKVKAFSPAGDGREAGNVASLKLSGVARKFPLASVPHNQGASSMSSENTIRNGIINVTATPLFPETENKLIYYLAGAFVFVMIFIVVPVSFALRKYMDYKRKTEKPRLKHTQTSALDGPARDEWELRPNHLFLHEKLGEGAFGTVFLGELNQASRGSQQVAVKMLRESNPRVSIAPGNSVTATKFVTKFPNAIATFGVGDEVWCLMPSLDCCGADQPSAEELLHFENEMAILKSVRSDPYVVKLIGCITLTRQKKIIMEFCALGNLQTFLSKVWSQLTNIEEPSGEECGSSNEIDHNSIELGRLWSSNCPAYTNQTYGILLGENANLSAELLSFARQIARGMEFLAMSGILHRDLATRNVLLADDRTIRISDFGLSRDVLESNVYRKLGCERIAVKWIAPECLENRVYTTFSDVWSYGIVLWEIVTLGSSPYANDCNNLERNLLQFLKSGKRLMQPCNCSIDLYDIMLACWHGIPELRPTFQALRERMENLENLAQSETHISLDKDRLLTFRSIRRSF